MTHRTATDHVLHELGGTRFLSYVCPSRGSAQLCAWRVELPPATAGQPHRVSHEEVLLVLEGRASAEVDGGQTGLGPGDVLVIPAGARVSLATSPVSGVSAWVTTSVGFRAELTDGTELAPAWVS